MALQPTNWPLNTYTAATWTDLITEPSTTSVVFAHNTGTGTATLQVRLFDGTNGYVIQNVTIQADETITLDMRGMVTVNTQSIQVQVDVTGVNIVACGTVQTA